MVPEGASNAGEPGQECVGEHGQGARWGTRRIIQPLTSSQDGAAMAILRLARLLSASLAVVRAPDLRESLPT